MKALTRVLKSENQIPLFLAGLLALIPFLSDSHAMDAYLVPRFTICAALIFLATASFTFQNKISIPKTPTAYALGAFLASAVLSLIFSSYLVEGLNSLLKTLTFATVFVLAASTSWADRNQFLILCKGLVIFAFGVSLFSIYQIHTQDLGWTYAQVNFSALKGQMGHPNLIASALTFSLFAIAYLVWRASRFWKIFSAISALAALYLLALSHSRAAILALLCGAVILVLIHFKIFQKLILFISHKWTLSTLTLLVVVSFFYIYLPQSKPSQNLKSYWQLPLGEFNSGDKQFSAQERLLLWKASWHMVENEGFLGVGPGAWRIEFPKYGSDIFRSRQGNVQFQRPHNDFLWVLSEYGIAGLLSFLALVFFAIRQGVLYLQKQPQSHWVKWAIAMIISYLVVASFSFPRERVFHQILFFTLLGGLSTLNLTDNLRIKKHSPVWGLALCIVLLLSTIAGGQNWVGEKITRNILKARAAGQWKDVIEYKEAAEPYFLYQLSPTSMPLEFYSGLAQMNLQNFNLALKEYEKAYQIHPNNLKVINNLANTHLILEHNQKAIEYYKKALSISYNYKEAILNLASIYHNSGKSEQAYSLLRSRAAVFDDSKELYEHFVYVTLHEAAQKRELKITEDKSLLLKNHYHFAYNDTISATLDVLKSLEISHSIN